MLLGLDPPTRQPTTDWAAPCRSVQVSTPDTPYHVGSMMDLGLTWHVAYDALVL
jgi:hypothetical protein